MCGIAGFVDPNCPAADREAAVARMCAAMVHRGPDQEGQRSAGPATIGMRRLAIFDPANGRQPMTSPDGRFVLVFNGAIFNFKDLRRELEGGWDFRTECDTEVLLAAFARWGERSLDRLRGMYAFAVWDTADESLFLARDPFGIKPLYYRRDGGRLLFASELAGLHASGVLSPEIDPAAVADYLGWFAVPAPRTLFRRTFALRPGECATLRRDRFEARRTWSFRQIPPADHVCASREEFTAQLRARLEDTIRAHLAADVPVGAFLSGGLDSAVIVGLMTRIGGARLRTFSIGFEDARFSEAEAAAATARHFGSIHETHVLTGTQVARDVERFILACDQPTGDGLNTYYVSQAARAGGVTVALSGLGGDELFGGYPSSQDLPRLARWLPWWRMLPPSLRHAVVRSIRHGDTRRRKLADLLNYGHNVHELASMQRRVFSEPRRRALLSPAARAASGRPPPYHPELRALSEDLQGASAVELASAWELRTYMADLLLRDSDVMSMRHSLELRVPFVDRPLLEWLWRQPARFRFTPAHPKSALARAASDLLPPDLAGRPKQGFTLPMAPWMRNELRPFLDDTFSEASIRRARYFEAGAVQAVWRSFLTSGDDRQWSRAWSLAVLIAFINRAAPAAVGSPPAAPVLSSGRSPERPAPARPPRPSRCTLLMTPELSASPGGIQRILRAYLRALCEMEEARGRGLKVLALNDAELDRLELRDGGAGALCDVAACHRDKRRFLREALRLGQGCDRIVCGHVAQLPVAWASSRIRPRQKYFLVAHGIEVWRPFNAGERLALRGVERIFCVSAHTRRELLRYAPVDPSRAVVLPNCLDPGFVVAPGRPIAQCPPTIVTIARLGREDRYKGVEALIEAMPAVRATEPAARLRIIGTGEDRERLESLARHLGVLGSAVEFLGFVGDEELSRELEECRLFALPSLKEGFGLVYLEAMARGRPCVAARAGGAPEVVLPDTGILVEPGDRRGLPEALVAGLRRPWDEAAIIARARHFSFDRFKDDLESQLAA